MPDSDLSQFNRNRLEAERIVDQEKLDEEKRAKEAEAAERKQKEYEDYLLQQMEERRAKLQQTFPFKKPKSGDNGLFGEWVHMGRYQGEGAVLAFEGIFEELGMIFGLLFELALGDVAGYGALYNRLWEQANQGPQPHGYPLRRPTEGGGYTEEFPTIYKLTADNRLIAKREPNGAKVVDENGRVVYETYPKGEAPLHMVMKNGYVPSPKYFKSMAYSYHWNSFVDAIHGPDALHPDAQALIRGFGNDGVKGAAKGRDTALENALLNPGNRPRPGK